MSRFSLPAHTLGLLFLAISVLFAVDSARAGAKKMPHFVLAEATSGQMIDSTSYAGKVKLVVFFATWCMPCMQEVPSLVSLQNEYGAGDFTVVAISVDEHRNSVQSFIDKNQINYPVLLFDRQVVADFGGIPGLPTTFVVDENDNVLKKYPGLVPHALLEREVKRMLEAAKE